MVSHHSAKFAGHRHCSSGNIMILVCNVIQQDYAPKGYISFMGWSLFTILPSLVVTGTVGGNIMLFFSHVTLQDHMIKALNYFIVRSSSRYATILNKFGGHEHCGSKDIIYLVCHVICQKHMIKEPCDFMVAIITLVIGIQWLTFFA